MDGDGGGGGKGMNGDGEEGGKGMDDDGEEMDNDGEEMDSDGVGIGAVWTVMRRVGMGQWWVRDGQGMSREAKQGECISL